MPKKVIKNPSNHKGPFLVLSCPFVAKIIPKDERWRATVDAFITYCNHRNFPAFASMYWFKKVDENTQTVVRDSAIIDRIKFDIDGDSHKMGNEDAKKQLNKLQDWLDGNGMDYEINFSGSDGYGVLMKFPPVKVKRAYKVVSELYNRFAEITKVNIDKAAMNGTQQKFRLVNSKHQRSGLYAIPLTKEQARIHSIDEIKRMAIRPREQTEFCNRKHNFMLTEVCEKYDQFDFNFGMSEDGPAPTVGYTKFSDTERLRPCTRLMMEKGLSGWYAMNIVSWEMIAVGYTDEEIHTWSKTIGNNTYKKDVTQYHLDKLRQKITDGDLYLHGCNAIKSLGFCVNEQAFDLNDCRDYERTKRAKKLRELINTD